MLEKNNYQKFFKKPKKITKIKNLSLKDKSFLDNIFEDIEFIKSTSRHVSNGLLFYKNFNFIENNRGKNKIENTKIFKNILHHFNLN